VRMLVRRSPEHKGGGVCAPAPLTLPSVETEAIGTAGELLVQYKLLKRDIDSAG